MKNPRVLLAASGLLVAVVLAAVRSCRLTGPGIDLEGRAPGGVTAAAR